MDFQRSGITPRAKERVKNDNLVTLKILSSTIGVMFIMIMIAWGYFIVNSNAYQLGKVIERQAELNIQRTQIDAEMKQLQDKENALREGMLPKTKELTAKGSINQDKENPIREVVLYKTSAIAAQSSVDAEPPSKHIDKIIPVVNAKEPTKNLQIKKDKVDKSATVSKAKSTKTVKEAELWPYKKNASIEQQHKINYIWHSMITTHNLSRKIAKKFLYTFEGENGLWTEDRRSRIVGANGYYDYGLCQINKGFHYDIVKNPKFFTDWKWQAEKCIELMKGGTRFYGNNPTSNKRADKNFSWLPKK